MASYTHKVTEYLIRAPMFRFTLDYTRYGVTKSVLHGRDLQAWRPYAEE